MICFNRAFVLKKTRQVKINSDVFNRTFVLKKTRQVKINSDMF